MSRAGFDAVLIPWLDDCGDGRLPSWRVQKDKPEFRRRTVEEVLDRQRTMQSRDPGAGTHTELGGWTLYCDESVDDGEQSGCGRALSCTVRSLLESRPSRVL